MTTCAEYNPLSTPGNTCTEYDPSSASNPPVPSWAVGLPPPISTPASLEADEVASLIRTKKAGVDFLIVDVRRADFENYFVQTAINLPAHSFHQTLPTVQTVLQRVPTVIFYCGSSNGRGPRCAAWYQDALNEKGVTASEAKVLAGGIKGFVTKFEELTTKI